MDAVVDKSIYHQTESDTIMGRRRSKMEKKEKEETKKRKKTKK